MDISKLLNDMTSMLSNQTDSPDERPRENSVIDIENEISRNHNNGHEHLDIRDYAQSLLEYAPVGVFISDSSGKLLYGNVMAWKTVGYNGGKLLGKNILNISLIHKDYLAKVAQIMVLSRLGRPTGPDEIQLIRSDGSSIWVELHSTPFRLDGKQMALGFIQDISDRKKAEETLQIEKDKAAGYFDIAGVILLVIDENARVTNINKKGCDLLGYRKDEILGKNWFNNCLPVEYRNETDLIYQKLMTGEIQAAEYYENPVLTKSGQIKTIAWHNTVLKDDNGSIIGTISSGEDITDRKQMEEQLFRLSSAISFSRDCIVITDANAIIIDVNQKALAMYGALRKEEMLGKHILELIIQEDRSKVNFDVFEIMEKGYQDAQVYNMISKQGESYTVRMSTSVILSAESTPMGMVRIYNRI